MTSGELGRRSKDHSQRPFDSLVDLLRRRRMTRTFSGGPSLDEVMFVADNSLLAPSAGFSQGVHLVLLTGDDLDSFWVKSRAKGWFAGRAPGVLEATWVVLVFGDRAEYLDRYAMEDKRDLGLSEASGWQTPYWLVDAGMVAQNFLLLCEERRWGALFFGVHGDQTKYFDEIGVPSSAHCIGAIAVGFRSADDAPSGSSRSKKRRDPGELVHVGVWRASECGT